MRTRVERVSKPAGERDPKTFRFTACESLSPLALLSSHSSHARRNPAHPTDRAHPPPKNPQAATTTTMEPLGAGNGGASSAAERWRAEASRTFQHYLDRAAPHTAGRWAGTLLAAAVYALRVYYVQGFYVVSYGLGIYLLNLLIGFLSPMVDPEVEALDGAGPALPTRGNDEFKPFIRRLPEFKFWYAITKAFCVAFVMTFFSVFDVPVFWPILLCYWIVLFVLTMKRQILHMIKYKYVPFSMGKQRYGGKKGPGASSSKD
ncbi:hypothetical protein ACQ4PT_010945 [Festuca glaucescens]